MACFNEFIKLRPHGDLRPQNEADLRREAEKDESISETKKKYLIIIVINNCFNRITTYITFF